LSFATNFIPRRQFEMMGEAPTKLPMTHRENSQVEIRCTICGNKGFLGMRGFAATDNPGPTRLYMEVS
jgi:hypothetical protein